MSGFRDDITHRPLPVSSASAHVVTRALVAALDAGMITVDEYAMTYAEICEPPRLPQLLGGRTVDPSLMERWQTKRSWHTWTNVFRVK